MKMPTGSRSPRINTKTSKSKGPTAKELIDKMRTSDNKVPIGTKVVSEEEFKRLAQENMAKDGEPMVEKTIFIVKPIYVNVDDLKAPKK